MQSSTRTRQTVSAMASDRPASWAAAFTLATTSSTRSGVVDLAAVRLEACGGVHVALAHGQQGHQLVVQGVHPGADLGHVLAGFGRQGGR